ncbi:BRO family protein [uncultured Helicobacter sp.]|uniref:BRO family protein n=1 Tax=uncultured Helicobacter sp. TaxID=175537 RepID=UPI002602F860|nr:BRO family protein [uncultured Helicobacter sp.]
MQLQIFHQNGFEIRGGLIEDKPYFVAMDIARALEYSETAMMLRRLDDDEIMELSADLAGGFSKHASNIKIINESGLYNAILGSKKPQAKAFKKWITAEVLPSIRKQGYYGNKPQEIDFLKEKIALQQELIATKTQLIALQKESIKSLKKQQQDKTRLTTKERIFKLLSKGKSQSQVSIELGISRSAVAYYVSKERQNERD